MPGKIHVPIGVSIEGLQQVSSAMGKLRNGIGATVGAFAALTARTTVNFAAGAIEGARDLERNIAGLETVFGSTTSQMMDFSKNAAAMGLSLSEAAKASTFIGSVLKQSGFSIQETADLTEDLVTLGADLALTYGYDVQEALLGMTALFRGEYDPIEKFGVAMKQSEIDAEKMARGMGHLTGAAERFADQQIRVEFLMERASDAMGQVEREANSLAVQQNRLNATFNTMRDIVGMELTPVIAELTSATADMLTRLMPKVTETFATFEEPIRRIMTGLLPVVESLLTEFMNFLQDVARIINIATDPTSRLGDALQSSALAVQYLFENFKIFGDKVPSFVDVVTNTLATLFETTTNITYAIQDTFWFIESFIAALGKYDIWKILWGDEAERRRFSSFISSSLYSKQRLRDATLEARNAEQDMVFTSEMLARVQKQQADRYLEFLDKRAQEVRDLAKEEERLANIADDVDLGLGDKISATEVKDPVADFISNLESEIEKQAARMQLRNMSFSDALVESIVGSGEGWEQVFKTIVDAGEEAAQALQDKFMLTKEGLEEYKQAVQDLYEELDRQAEAEAEIAQINKELAEQIARIKEDFADFKEEISDLSSGIDALATYQREIGRFESATTRQLENIEDSIKSAFDNEMILEDAKNSLSSYARSELSLLIGIQKQRDELFAQRELAATTIFGIAQSIAESAKIIDVLSSIEDKTQEIQVSEVIEGVVKSADGLRDFKTTLTRNFVEVVTETIDKSKALTDNFQTVIDRTRIFIDNLNTLRELELDPFLFNQLVEAGAEAGGATAQALVDGGADTINEVNRLQGELNAMGVELGEMTYEVMKDQGEMFVSGIIDGLDDQLLDLEIQAVTMAQAFADAFEAAFNRAIDAMELKQIEIAQAEAQRRIDEVQQEIKPIVDQATVDKLNGLIAGAERYANQIGDLTKKAGAGVKQTIYEGLLEDALAGRAIDISGIQSGMSSSELAQAALAARQPATTVVNNITYTSDSPLTAYNAATKTVNDILTYNTSSGDYQVTLTGFGA